MSSFENGGMQKFIEQKRAVEKERPRLTSEPRLITVDGVDGSGKSTIAKKIAENLRRIHGEDKVVLVNITNLVGSPKQEKLSKIAEDNDLTNERLSRVYAAGVNRAYEEVILPALAAGKIVVADRSEIDLLRFALESGDASLVEKRRAYIAEGTLTHRLWAGNRVFIEAPPEDILKNLEGRPHLSRYDPRSLEEVRLRIKHETSAEQELESIAHEGTVNIVRESNPRIEGSAAQAAALEELADRIVRNIKL